MDLPSEFGLGELSDGDEHGQRVTTRKLHMVRVDGVEHFYWDLAPALDLLAAEPDADFEMITVH